MHIVSNFSLNLCVSTDNLVMLSKAIREISLCSGQRLAQKHTSDESVECSLWISQTQMGPLPQDSGSNACQRVEEL